MRSVDEGVTMWLHPNVAGLCLTLKVAAILACQRSPVVLMSKPAHRVMMGAIGLEGRFGAIP
jgi:hypothetical protein